MAMAIPKKHKTSFFKDAYFTYIRISIEFYKPFTNHPGEFYKPFTNHPGDLFITRHRAVPTDLTKDYIDSLNVYDLHKNKMYERLRRVVQ